MARRYTCGKTAKSWRRSLEIREGLPKDPGALPPSLTLEKLRHPHGSVPGNPLLAEPLYLTKYIERMGTGTGDVIKLCREAGLAEPEFTLTDGFVTTIRRKPELAFKAIGGQVEAPSWH